MNPEEIAERENDKKRELMYLRLDCFKIAMDNFSGANTEYKKLAETIERAEEILNYIQHGKNEAVKD